MKSCAVIFFLLVILNSCFLFSKYKRIDFTYNEGSQLRSVPVVVPKGFTKEKTEVDSSGNTILSYSYDGNAFFYIAHMADSSVHIQPIAEEDNIPRIALTTGAIIYKGVDADNLLWKEVRQNDLRVGYRFVSKDLESRFDSATNYAVVHLLKIHQ
jgi:hypothetical protein